MGWDQIQAVWFQDISSYIFIIYYLSPAKIKISARHRLIYFTLYSLWLIRQLTF